MGENEISGRGENKIKIVKDEAGLENEIEVTAKDRIKIQ